MKKSAVSVNISTTHARKEQYNDNTLIKIDNICSSSIAHQNYTEYNQFVFRLIQRKLYCSKSLTLKISFIVPYIGA